MDKTVAAVHRYEFGKNWQRFLTTLNNERILAAERSLKELLEVDNCAGKRFLDVGSGSGLFSLAARRLGAHVYSFDYDCDSVACTRTLKQRYFPDDGLWSIDQGSVLDADYLKRLGRFDIVYAWGVLHHTGVMWQALENVLIPLAEGGSLAVAIYNDQGWISVYWRHVKRIYALRPAYRFLVACTQAPILVGTRAIPRLMNGRIGSERGMALWYDLKDWLGGYPFEVATPVSIVNFYRSRGLVLTRFRPSGDPSGNNEFVFGNAGRTSSRHPGASDDPPGLLG